MTIFLNFAWLLVFRCQRKCTRADTPNDISLYKFGVTYIVPDIKCQNPSFLSSGLVYETFRSQNIHVFKDINRQNIDYAKDD